MNKAGFIDHKGKKIFLIDAAGCTDPEENIATLDQAEQLILREPAHSVLLLTDVTDLHYDGEVVGRLRKFSSTIGPHIKASTTVGIVGMKKIVVRTLNVLTGRRIEVHPDRDAALEWLIAQ